MWTLPVCGLFKKLNLFHITQFIAAIAPTVFYYFKLFQRYLKERGLFIAKTQNYCGLKSADYSLFDSLKYVLALVIVATNNTTQHNTTQRYYY